MNKQTIDTTIGILSTKYDSFNNYNIVDTDITDNVYTIVTVNCVITIKVCNDGIGVNVIYDKFENEQELDKEFTDIKEAYNFIDEYIY